MAITTLESKDPDGINVNYKVDLTNYLQTGETVSSIVSVDKDDAALTVASSQITDSGKSVTVFLTGGTLGQLVTVTTRFTVSGSPSRTDDRSFRILIEQL